MKRFKEIKKEISELLVKWESAVNELSPTQEFSNAMRVLEKERRELIQSMLIGNKQDCEANNMHDYLLEAADPILDENIIPKGYRAICIVSFGSFLHRRCYDTYFKITPPNGEPYYLGVCTTKYVDFDIVFE